MASKPTKTVRHQKFLTEYTAKWDFIVPSVKGETYARCNSCNSDFSIKSSGAYDTKIHIESAKHKSSAEARASNHAITSFFASEKDDFSVIRAETLWTQFVVDHNMPFTTSDAFTDATEFRPNLSTEVLSLSLTNKLYWQAAGVPCHKRELKRDLLQKCKKATVEYNKSMSQRNL